MVDARQTKRIAMWSGPRNISTAMMRSWGARPDTRVCDEPLYAHYLRKTGLDHPGAAQVIAHHDSDWTSVVGSLTEDTFAGKSIFYQKHMAHHLLPEITLQWIEKLDNCFLIREPRAMIASLAKVLPNPDLEATGLPQQLRLFEHVCRQQQSTPPVIDARSVLESPVAMLRALCGALGVDYTDAMLRWAPGERDTDGVWGRYWYEAVWNSTGFAPYQPKHIDPPARLLPLVRQCDALYTQLHEHCICA